MNRILHLLALVAFALGLAVVLWVGFGYIGRSTLALLMTGLIATAYLAGASELLRFNRASTHLARALDRLHAHAATDEGQAGPDAAVATADWLAGVPPALAGAVRQRVAGEALALPGPALSPYLVGMLVLLGMLGTFLGMVLTLDGTVQALEMSTDLQAMRGALAAPVKGLGVAFGTSVAGVAASVMLGLMLALARRQRQQLAHRLNRCLQGALRSQSLAWQRSQAYAALGAQAENLPRLIDRVEQMMNALLVHHDRAQAAQQLAQTDFHARTGADLQALAQRLEHSLQSRLETGLGEAAAALQSVTEQHLATVQAEAALRQQQLADSQQQQLAALASDRAAARVELDSAIATQLALQRAEQAAAAAQLEQAQVRFADLFERQQGELLANFEQRLNSIEQLLVARTEQADQRHEQALQDFSAGLGSQWQAQAAAAQQQQASLCDALGQGVRAMLDEQASHNQAQRAELEKVLVSAAAAPQAVTKLLAGLEHDLAERRDREQRMLAAHQQVLERVQTVLGGLDASAHEQAAASVRLVSEAAQTLAEVSTGFAAQTASQREQLAAGSAELHVSALEVASMSEAFALAVAQFADSNEQLGVRLHSIESRLEQSLQRSDEQLAYYVAQARELIDLSLLAQQRLIAELGAGSGPASMAGEFSTEAVS